MVEGAGAKAPRLKEPCDTTSEARMLSSTTADPNITLFRIVVKGVLYEL